MNLFHDGHLTEEGEKIVCEIFEYMDRLIQLKNVEELQITLNLTPENDSGKLCHMHVGETKMKLVFTERPYVFGVLEIFRGEKGPEIEGGGMRPGDLDDGPLITDRLNNALHKMKSIVKQEGTMDHWNTK